MEENQNRSKNLIAAIEGILFASGGPQKIAKIAKVIEKDIIETKNLLIELKKEYQNENRGLDLIFLEDKVQLVSSPFTSFYIKKFLEKDFSEELSFPLLETLAILAYKGPMSRHQIEEIRGVNSVYALRSLCLRGLIEREPHPDIPRAYLYKISFEFLKHLGVSSLKELPDYERFSSQ